MFFICNLYIEGDQKKFVLMTCKGVVIMLGNYICKNLTVKVFRLCGRRKEE